MDKLIFQEIGADMGVHLGRSGEDKAVREEVASLTSRHIQIRMKSLIEKRLDAHIYEIGKLVWTSRLLKNSNQSVTLNLGKPKSVLQISFRVKSHVNSSQLAFFFIKKDVGIDSIPWADF